MALLMFEVGIVIGPITSQGERMWRNNEGSISGRPMAGRRKFSPVWFARNHPRYREIELHEIVNRFNCAETVQEHTTNSRHRVNDQVIGLLKNADKTVKNLVRPRTQEHDWRQACSNH